MAETATRTHRSLLVVVGVLLVATISGMAALWPRAADLPEPDGEPLDDLVAGEVRSVELHEGEADPVVGSSGEFAVLRILLLDGPDEGATIELEIQTDGFPEIEEGDRVALDRTTDPEGEVQYFLTDFQRLPTLLWLVALFIGVVLVVSRWHGLRSLVGLGLSLLIIVQFVVPAILGGQSPPLVALVGAVAVMIVTLYLTHGVNEMTTSAIVGTAGALTVTVALGLLFIGRGKITGFASDDAVFARFAIEGLDLQGLVLAGLIIAALGVLDDVTISQASTVFALHDTDRTLSFTALFARAMKVGRDHIASVVNTLVLAYVGASLALLVLFSTGDLPVLEILNSEVLAEEIIKTLVGSLGLILAVPFTTALAASVAVGRPPEAPPLGGTHVHGGSPATGRRVAAGTRGARAGSERRRPAGETTSAGAHLGGAPGERDADREDSDLDEDERAYRAWVAYLERRREDDDVDGPDR